MQALSKVEKDFIKLCIENNVRPDGRTKYERSQIEIAFGPNTLCNSNGSCKLKLPDSQSLLYISAKAEISQPSPTCQKSGTIELQIGSSKLTDLSLNKANYLKTKIADITMFLKNGQLDLIPLEKLGLLEGSLAWKVYLDIFVLGE